MHGHVTDTLERAGASVKTGAVLGGDEGQAETGMEMRKHGVGNRDALSTILTTSEADAWYSPSYLGLYRNNLLQQFLEAWYNQKFLGTHCTFGDDRHLTNRMLSMGYATK